MNWCSDWQMVSGSEDGTARLWDLRQYALTAMVEPASEHSLARPHLGKWIGDVDINSNWLVSMYLKSFYCSLFLKDIEIIYRTQVLFNSSTLKVLLCFKILIIFVLY